ncbi:MAG: D-glycero-alpha-D-manno-heptose-1,7-bisphosphate 7-phosphatase [Bacillota bacterium]
MKGDAKSCPAVFLDRDGVIIKEVGYITHPGQIELYSDAGSSIAALNRSGFLCIVITNQSAVARGMITENDLANIHGVIMERLSYNGARLDAIYYCPHLPPDAGEQDVPPYRVRCKCRKPKSGMIEKALGEFNIDIGRSFIIGDRESDIVAGYNAGLSTILLNTGYGTQSYEGNSGIKPDIVFQNLAEAVEFIKETIENK